MLLRTLAALFVAGARGHGFMLKPTPRQTGASDLSHGGTVCSDCSCCWYTNQVTVRAPTICDRSLMTGPMATPGKGVPCNKYDPTKTHPWRAPGQAPMFSSCGAQGGARGHPVGTSLRPRTPEVWKQGGTARVGMAITANHGGGYSYRLCPKSMSPTEACFQQHPLAFASNTTEVIKLDGQTITIPATRTSVGTHPAGSQWTKNPIPEAAGFFPEPFAGAVGSQWKFSLVDEVVVPASLPAGGYVLSWRWDCELTPQVWSNCGDIEITASNETEPLTGPPLMGPVEEPPEEVVELAAARA